MNIEIPDGTLKKREGRYVVYDRDYLLDNLAQEIYFLEHSRQHPLKDKKELLVRIRREVNEQT